MCPSSTTSSEPDDGIIAVLDGSFARPHAAVVGFVLGLSTLVVGGRLAVDALRPAPVAEIIGTERAEDEARRAAARFRDGSLAAWAERRLRLTSRIRQITAPWYARALYRASGEIHPSVVAGDDGWLFKTDRLVPVPEPEDRLLGRSAATLAAIHRRVRVFGVDVRVLLVPRKSDVYREALPRGVDARPDLYGKLRLALEERGVRTPDLLAAFREERERGLWHRADTHWNDEGMRLAAAVIARDSGAPPADAPRATRIVEAPEEPESADLFRLAGLPCGDLAVPRSPDHEHRPLRVVDAAGSPVPYIHGADPTPAPIVLTGTSFTAGRSLPHLLLHASGSLVRTDAWPAEGPGEPIRRSLQGIVARGTLPELMIWEIPGYALLCHYGGLDGIGAALAEVPAPPMTRIADLAGAELPGIFPGDAPLRPGRLVVGDAPLATWVRKGVVHHDGDGAVSVRLRGRVEGAAVRVRVGSESHWIEGDWAAPRPEIVLPVLGVRGESYAFVEVRGAGASTVLDLASIDLVADLDAAAAVHANPVPFRGERTGIASFAFDSAPAIERQAALLVTWRGVDAIPAGGVEVEIRTEDPDRRTFRWTIRNEDGPGPGLAAFGLDRIAGLRPWLVKITAEGLDPMEAAIYVRILPQRKAE